MWKSQGANGAPVWNAQTRTVFIAPGRADSPATAHAHAHTRAPPTISSAHSSPQPPRSGLELHTRSIGVTGDLEEHLLHTWPLLAPELHFCNKANVSSRVFRQLSASKAWNIALLCSTRRESPFLLSLQKMKPEQVVQSNSNRLSRLQPNGHN